MPNDDSKPPVSRRETLKLATAVSALGLGLGVVFDGKNAAGQVLKGAATSVKLEASKVGTVSLKLYKLNGDAFDLLHTLDLSGLLAGGGTKGENVIAVKLFNQKGDQATMLSSHELHVVQQKG